MYRRTADGDPLVLCVHMGGPFWARRDAAAWSIPKGEYGDDEDPRTAAIREFREETGAPPPPGPLTDLGEFRQAGGKRVRAWCVEGDFDTAALRSNTFEMEWPPRSGRMQRFPEVDRAEWMTPEAARVKLVAGQVPILDSLLRHLSDGDAHDR